MEKKLAKKLEKIRKMVWSKNQFSDIKRLVLSNNSNMDKIDTFNEYF